MPVMSGSQLGVSPLLCQYYRTAHGTHVAWWVSKVYFRRAVSAVARTVTPHAAFSTVFHEAALGGATGQRASCN